MLDNKSETIKTLMGVVISTGLTVCTQGSSHLILGALGSIASGFAVDFIGKIEYNKIKKFLQETDPSDLNHDLQKIIIQSVEWAVVNIQILYKKEGLDNKQTNELKQFTNDLIEQIGLLKHQLAHDSNDLYKIIETPKNQQEVFKIFDLNVDSFPVINPDNAYHLFFKKHFIPNLQLCFGELLKDKKNRPALIAYQREIYQTLNTSIDKVISQNKEILETLKAPKQNKIASEENKKWNLIKENIQSKDLTEVTPEFEHLINVQLSDIKQNTDLLVDITSDLKEELERVKGIIKGIGIGIDKNWIQKNKVIIISLFSIAILLIVGLVYKINTSPFQMNIGLAIDKNIKIHSEYPKLSNEARLRFYFPNKTIEKEITFNNEIIITEILTSLKNRKCKIELLDKYWITTKDSILIDEGVIHLNIIPNDRLANIKGRVKSRNLQDLIHDAKIIIDGIETTSNQNGEFTITMPIEKRKTNYVIRVEKEGYLSAEKYCVPNDFCEILIKQQ